MPLAGKKRVTYNGVSGWCFTNTGGFCMIACSCNKYKTVWRGHYAMAERAWAEHIGAKH